MRFLMEECWSTSIRLVWGALHVRTSFIFIKLTLFILLQLFQSEECISFDAQQKVPVGLLQPAPAVFYDYYEPSKTTICFGHFLAG